MSSAMSTPETPPWPSLYDPSVDLLRIAHNDPLQPNGHYLTDANDVFRFTLYWSFVFYLPIFALSGIVAFTNIAFAPTPQHFSYSSLNSGNQPDSYPLAPIPSSPAASPTPTAFGTNPKATTVTRPPAPASRRTPPRVNPHRSRAVYAILALLTYLAAGLLGAVVGSAVMGYILAALFKAGKFYISTWIPPLFALVQASIGLLGIYPSIAEII